ncbi:MAG TPA: hemerythrin domain-containing protein [Pyrinomonadaceae bacterium]|nr:hemerythrin domain-containing protein [Pyrinomonadaceae bacterium]
MRLSPFIVATSGRPFNIITGRDSNGDTLFTERPAFASASTRQEMDRLRSLLEKVCSVHGQNYPELLTVQALFRELCMDLTPHMFKEEQMLFPYIERMEEAAKNGHEISAPPFGTVRNPVRMMMMEHDTAGDLLRKLRETSSDYTVPKDGCISYQTLYQAMEAFEQDLHQHIHLENNVLFPRAVEMEDATG